MLSQHVMQMAAATDADFGAVAGPVETRAGSASMADM
jgi:hypothetical protein